MENKFCRRMSAWMVPPSDVPRHLRTLLAPVARCISVRRGSRDVWRGPRGRRRLWCAAATTSLRLRRGSGGLGHILWWRRRLLSAHLTSARVQLLQHARARAQLDHHPRRARAQGGQDAPAEQAHARRGAGRPWPAPRPLSPAVFMHNDRRRIDSTRSRRHPHESPGPTPGWCEQCSTQRG